MEIDRDLISESKCHSQPGVSFTPGAAQPGELAAIFIGELVAGWEIMEIKKHPRGMTGLAREKESRVRVSITSNNIFIFSRSDSTSIADVKGDRIAHRCPERRVFA
jgi:hypothetical protein